MSSRAIIQLVLAAFFALGIVGCQKKATNSIPSNTSVTDITPAPAPAYQPAQPAQSNQPQQPVVYDSMQTGSGGTNGGTAMGSGNYTVRKGDTLYSIAKTRYGDGKQWQRIAAAKSSYAMSFVRRSLRDGTATVRRAAVMGLAAFGDKAVLADLEAACEDSDGAVRAAALKGLAGIDAERAKAKAAAHAADRDPAVKEIATALLTPPKKAEPIKPVVPAPKEPVKPATPAAGKGHCRADQRASHHPGLGHDVRLVRASHHPGPAPPTGRRVGQRLRHPRPGHRPRLPPPRPAAPRGRDPEGGLRADGSPLAQ